MSISKKKPKPFSFYSDSLCVKNNIFIKLQVYYVTILIASLSILFSCDTNIFGNETVDPSTLESKSNVDIIYSLYQDKVTSSLFSDDDARTSLIAELQTRVNDSTDNDQILAKMALMGVYSKASKLKYVVTDDSTDTLVYSSSLTLDFSSATQIRDFINYIFRNVPVADRSEVLDLAMPSFDLSDGIGVDLNNDIQYEGQTPSFPAAVRQLSGDYAYQAVMISIIEILFNQVRTATSKVPADDNARKTLLLDYINNTNSTTLFDPANVVIQTEILGILSPTGAKYMLLAAGFSSLIDMIAPQ